MKKKISTFILIFFICFAGFAFAEDIEIKPSQSLKFQNTLLLANTSVDSLGLGNPILKKDLANGYTVLKYSEGFILQHGVDRKITFAGIYSKEGKVLLLKGKPFKISDKADVENILGKPSSVVPVTSKDLYPESSELCIYAKDGVSFQYDLSGKITAVLIFKPSIFGN